MSSREAEMEMHSERVITGVPEGLDALVLAQLVAEAGHASAPGTLLHVARDDRRLDALERALAFFAPQVRVDLLPAWDTVPYDRVGPNADIVAKRIAALAKLGLSTRKHPTVVLTTVNAVLQRVPPRAFLKRAIKPIAPGQRIDMGQLDAAARASWATSAAGPSWSPANSPCAAASSISFRRAGRRRCASISSAIRWRRSRPSRCRRSGRSKPVQKLALLPVSEVALGEEAEKLFRGRYVELFGGSTGDDPLYEAVSSGQRYPGQEHWLPLFHEHLETTVRLSAGRAGELRSPRRGSGDGQRFEQIAEHYDARLASLEQQAFGAPPYKPVPAERMYPRRQVVVRGP